MNDISFGAVGAAVIAGLVSLLGLIIGKEQKVSEFRQAWINELRSCLIAYLVNINAISDSLRLKAAGQSYDNNALIQNYKSLNEASHGIKLRVNSKEPPSKSLLAAMNSFEKLADDNANLTPSNIREIENGFMEASRSLLKYEWRRVKAGEKIYVTARWITLATTVLMAMVLVLIWVTHSHEGPHSPAQSSGDSRLEPIMQFDLNCPNLSKNGKNRIPVTRYQLLI